MKKNKEKDAPKQQETTEAAQEATQEAAKEVAQEENAGQTGPVDELQKKLDEANAKIEETTDKYVRLMAEFDNFRRRSARERLELIEQADKDVLKGFLPIIDDCERALKVLRQSDASEAAIEGTELILNKLFNYLKSCGVTRIEAKGEDFNTDFHEAVAQFPAPSPEMKNKVIDVTEQGYMLKGKVMRFAKVVVGI